MWLSESTNDDNDNDDDKKEKKPNLEHLFIHNHLH